MAIFNKSYVIARRGYASVSNVAESMRESVVGIMKKGSEESKKSTSSWIPDPKTGYYRPEGHDNQIDPAELREMLLKNRTRRN